MTEMLVQFNCYTFIDREWSISGIVMMTKPKKMKTEGELRYKLESCPGMNNPGNVRATQGISAS